MVKIPAGKLPYVDISIENVKLFTFSLKYLWYFIASLFSYFMSSPARRCFIVLDIQFKNFKILKTHNDELRSLMLPSEKGIHIVDLKCSKFTDYPLGNNHSDFNRMQYKFDQGLFINLWLFHRVIV